MSAWLAIHVWSEPRALKALSEANITTWRPTILIRYSRQAHRDALQPQSVFAGYIFAPETEAGSWGAISREDGVIGFLTSNGLGPRFIDQAELEPAILYTWAHALTHTHLAGSKRRRRRMEKGFASLAQLLDQPKMEKAA